jgi:hypothetical protein
VSGIAGAFRLAGGLVAVVLKLAVAGDLIAASVGGELVYRLPKVLSFSRTEI